MKRLPLATSFLLFIVLCITTAFWAMELFKPPVRSILAPPDMAQPAANLDAAAGLFGGRTTFVVASNFQLIGVVVASNAAESVAILATDGNPAQTIRANTEVMPGVKLTEVHRTHVLLSDGGVIKRVELPEISRNR